MLRQSKERKIRCNVMGQTAEPHKTFEYYVRGHCTAVALSSVEQRSTMLPVKKCKDMGYYNYEYMFR